MYRISANFGCLFTLIFLSVILLPSSRLIASNYDVNDWAYTIRYVNIHEVSIYSDCSETSKISGRANYLDKLLIVLDPDKPVKTNWFEVVFPVKGFVKDNHLITEEEKLELDQKFDNDPDEDQPSSKWIPRLMTVNSAYSILRMRPSYTAKIKDALKYDTDVLFVDEIEGRKKVWYKILYPLEGYINIEDIDASSGNSILSVGISAGVFNLPFEKNLENYHIPFGGYLQFTKANWDISFRLGYNYTEFNLKKYLLKTHLAYFQIQYNLLEIMKDKLNFFLFGGACYWSSSFKNTKYPSLKSYFPEEKDSGPGYRAGAGLKYNISNFSIETLYSFFGSEEAVFGKEPVSGEFTNQYKLFPGYNQIELSVAYNFEL